MTRLQEAAMRLRPTDNVSFVRGVPRFPSMVLPVLVPVSFGFDEGLDLLLQIESAASVELSWLSLLFENALDPAALRPGLGLERR